MICPKCGSKAIQARQLDILEHAAINMTSCIICGHILQHSAVDYSQRKIKPSEFKRQTKHVRGGGLPCSVAGCKRDYYAKGLCRLHYSRRLKYLKRLDRLQSDYSDVCCVAG